MKARPILFSSPEVRAILEGRKTQTRRVVKPPRGWPNYSHCDPFAMPPAAWWWNGEHDRAGVRQECPYGQPGDRLWVRESIEVDHHGSITTSKYCADGAFTTATEWPWKRNRLPSCPRRLSRIMLEIVSGRVERLQGISTADCWAEGVAASPDVDPVHEYCGLWESINGTGSWDANPWVWVIEFKRVEQEPQV